MNPHKMNPHKMTTLQETTHENNLFNHFVVQKPTAKHEIVRQSVSQQQNTKL